MNKHLRGGVVLVFCAVAILAACGNMGQAKTSQMNMGPMNRGQPNPDQTQTSQTKAVEVQITLSDFHITSSTMTFRAGVPYHFNVTNTGKAAHELMLMSSTMKTMDMNGMPMDDMDAMALTSVEVMQPGETSNFNYTFVFSKAGPHPEFSCHLPGHYETGMHLDVTVNT